VYKPAALAATLAIGDRGTEIARIKCLQENNISTFTPKIPGFVSKTPRIFCTLDRMT